MVQKSSLIFGHQRFMYDFTYIHKFFPITNTAFLFPEHQRIMFRVNLSFCAKYFILLTATLWSSSSLPSSAPEERRIPTKVLILGAGLAGITAAKTLLENNITDFYILEAKDHIGGRIHAVQFEGVTIETGANWLHSLNDDDSAAFAKRMDVTRMSGIWCNYSDIIIRLVEEF